MYTHTTYTTHIYTQAYKHTHTLSLTHTHTHTAPSCSAQPISICLGIYDELSNVRSLAGQAELGWTGLESTGCSTAVWETIHLTTPFLAHTSHRALVLLIFLLVM